MNNIYLYIFVMFAVTYAVRILPLTLIRKPIENRFVKSFLFPATIDASGAVWVGALTMAAGLLAAWFGAGLFPTAAICCVIVFACSFLG